MTTFDIIYDSSVEVSLQFYNTSTQHYISAEEAQSLTNQGAGRIVIGSVARCSSVILHDADSSYWECYYNTDTDRFLCETDANTLVQIGLGRIVAGKIPYVITKENGSYFDVVKNRGVGEQMALQTVSGGVAVIKNKDVEHTVEDEFVDAPEPHTPTSSIPPSNAASLQSSTCYHDNIQSRSTQSPPSYDETMNSSSSRSAQGNLATSTQGNLATSTQGNLATSTQGASQLQSASQPGPGSVKPAATVVECPAGEGSGLAQKEGSGESSFLEKVAPIAAGVAVAGVAIAGVAAAIFLGSGSGKNKKKKKK